jgi:hypothetical protein
MGTHGGQPLQGLKDLLPFDIFGTIDYLGFPGQIGHPLLGERSPNDVTAKFFGLF